MAEKADPLTTEIQVTIDNTTIADLLGDRYARMESGEVRSELENLYGPVWSEEQLQEQFDVDFIDAPYVHVRRKEDGTYGTLAFVDAPRFYFLFEPIEGTDDREKA